MKLYYPVAKKPISFNQLFEQNANSYYKEANMKGHGAIDFPCQFNETIYCAQEALVFAVRNKDNPDLMKYRAVYTLVEADGEYFEVSYGHANNIFVNEGQYVDIGTPLMSGGNTGDVASGGIKVTRAMKEAGSHAGTHLHFQVRKIIQVKTRSLGKQYLMNSKGYFKQGDFFFEIQDYNNGYKGCIDPMPFLNGLYAYENVPDSNNELLELVKDPSHFSHSWNINLKRGDFSLDVKYLQIALLILGFMQPFPAKDLGHFGGKTAQALEKFQKSQGIIPTAPNNFGPKSRASMNRLFMVK